MNDKIKKLSKYEREAFYQFKSARFSDETSLRLAKIAVKFANVSRDDK